MTHLIIHPSTQSEIKMNKNNLIQGKLRRIIFIKVINNYLWDDWSNWIWINTRNNFLKILILEYVVNFFFLSKIKYLIYDIALKSKIFVITLHDD